VSVMISTIIIKELVKSSEHQIKELGKIYSLIPATRCKRRAECCSLLPDATLLEALSALKCLMTFTVNRRIKLLQKIAYYFFMNPVEVVSCPFLEDNDCLIYSHRFFGCRAYGLWSGKYYENLSGKSRHAKTFIRKQWGRSGISLPTAVMDFHVPYCSNVKVEKNKFIDDQMLLNISDRIETLSQHFGQWDQMFRQMYFSDLSFLVASLIYGFPESVRLKFTIVSDVVKRGIREKLDKTLLEAYDIFS
jgi:Fe-S-cluster containining protein